MPQPLQLLLVADDDKDLALYIEQLETAGFHAFCTWVLPGEALHDVFGTQPWDAFFAANRCVTTALRRC